MDDGDAVAGVEEKDKARERLTRAGSAADLPVTVIRPSRGWAPLNLRDLWTYRELLYFFTWRDLKVRYKHTVVGAGWAVIQPLCMMLIFVVVFGILTRVPTRNIPYPYPIFVLSGLVPWQLFAMGLQRASISLVEQQGVITKIYFPRLILPISAVLATALDFVIGVLVLLAMMAFFGLAPTATVVALPAFALLVVVTTLGIGFWMSAVNVRYRDVGFVLTFLVQLWFFATPIFYSSKLVPERFQPLYGLNPMAGALEGFRWALLGKDQAPGLMLWVSAAMVAFVFVAGLFYFRRTEQTFADVV
jgi:lipopolysaccharide transport system permease protein